VSEREIPPEEQDRIARELAEELRRLRVEDVLLSTLTTVSSIAYRRLGVMEGTQEDRDLEQVRLGIETMTALTPVLERFVPAELVRDFNTSVANLKLSYAKVVSDEGRSPERSGEEAAASEPGGRRGEPAAPDGEPSDS
jgi:hypothetical protein